MSAVGWLIICVAAILVMGFVRGAWSFWVKGKIPGGGHEWRKCEKCRRWSSSESSSYHCGYDHCPLRTQNFEEMESKMKIVEKQSPGVTVTRARKRVGVVVMFLLIGGSVLYGWFADPDFNPPWMKYPTLILIGFIFSIFFSPWVREKAMGVLKFILRVR